jgi:hypothetical protein
VYEFDDGRELMMMRALISAGACRQYKQRRPQSLSPAADDVIRDLPDQRDVGSQPISDYVVDSPQVVGYECTYGVDGHSGKKTGDDSSSTQNHPRVTRLSRQ